jgi:hypoxanthine phosphoribosyltransferase
MERSQVQQFSTLIYDYAIRIDSASDITLSDSVKFFSVFFIIMIAESLPCQLVSWDEAYQLSRKLSCVIKSSGFRPDLIVAIGRGGYVPARIVCDFLMHSLLASIKIEHWDKAACKRPEAAVRFPLAVDVHGQDVIIIDDITDTGDTLKAAIDYISSLGAHKVKTGVMQHKTTSSVVPDFYAEILEDWKWIIYPWAAHEDLVGFTERVLSVEPETIGQIQASLKELYSLDVREKALQDVLADLVEMEKAERIQEKYKKLV